MGSRELCARDVISNSGEGRRGDSTRRSTGEEPQRPISVQFQGPEERNLPGQWFHTGVQSQDKLGPPDWNWGPRSTLHAVHPATRLPTASM